MPKPLLKKRKKTRLFCQRSRGGFPGCDACAVQWRNRAGALKGTAAILLGRNLGDPAVWHWSVNPSICKFRLLYLSGEEEGNYCSPANWKPFSQLRVTKSSWHSNNLFHCFLLLSQCLIGLPAGSRAVAGGEIKSTVEYSGKFWI